MAIPISPFRNRITAAGTRISPMPKIGRNASIAIIPPHKNRPSQETLEKTAYTIAHENSLGNFFKFPEELTLLLVRKGRELEDIGDKTFLVDQEEKDNNDHHEKTENKIHDVCCPGTSLVV